MTDPDTELRRYAGDWKAQEPRPPDLGRAVAVASRRHRGRFTPVALGVAAAATVLLVAGMVATFDATHRQKSSAPATAVITGTLEMVGGPVGTPSRPLPGRIYAYMTARPIGESSATTSADARGHFVLHIPAGTWYLRATSPDFGITPTPPSPPCFSDGPVHARAGNVARAIVICEAK